MIHPGTRFRVFPKFDEGFSEPELLIVDAPPGSIGPGPSDARMYVCNPVAKSRAYDAPGYMPPYDGAMHAPAMPDRLGHFDHIAVGTPQFRAAHLYASVRATLDAWERTLGQPILWWFGALRPRLELVPMIAWDNAQSGAGYLETGLHVNPDGSQDPYWQDLDVVAHETGHITLFSTIGVPDEDWSHGAFLAFHEAFADLFAVIGGLRFRSVRRRLLAQTEGNLYVLNLVTRIGELTDNTQIRIASNQVRMADVAGIEMRADGLWHDPSGRGRNVFALAAPLTGAVFDILVEIYQEALVARGLIPRAVRPARWTPAAMDEAYAMIHAQSARAYGAFADGFEACLDEARDAVARCMAHLMLTIRPETLTFETVAARLLEGAAEVGLEPMLPALLGHFLWRGIDPRPFFQGRLPSPQPRRGLASNAAIRAPVRPRHACETCRSLGGFMLAGRLQNHEYRRTPSLFVR